MKKDEHHAATPEGVKRLVQLYEEIRYSKSRGVVLFRTLFLIAALAAIVWIVWWVDWS